MTDWMKQREELLKNGFTTLTGIYSSEEIENIINIINRTDSSRSTFRKSTELFAIRQFLKEVPEVIGAVFNENLKSVIDQFFGHDFFVVKSIYFDKPENSNWYVSYHQDLTISVDRKIDLPGFGPWTIKQNQFGVQPPIEILENIYTVRIHLDVTDEDNGALRVVPKSHLKKIYRPEAIDWNLEMATSCQVSCGGIMIMKPLLLHSSGRTTNGKKRRVIHIEFSNIELPEAIQWAERLSPCFLPS